MNSDTISTARCDANLPLILIGGGGHCKSVIEAARANGMPIHGILDLPSRVGEEVLGIKIIGTDEEIGNYLEGHRFLVTLGFISDPTRRNAIYRQLTELEADIATVIASTAFVAQSATIGRGTVILQGAVINADAHIGENVIVNSRAIVEHESTVGDNCHISTGVIINGKCQVGNSTFIGSGTIAYNNIDIAGDSIIAAGSVVTHPLRRPGIYAGNPAKLIKAQ